MFDLNEFAKNFNGLEIPIELVKLLEFENEISKYEFYSEGFELLIDVKKLGLKTYSEDENFLSSILEFANADHSGSTYGFWLKNNNLSESPIAAFGSEGGFHIVAKDIRELLQILTFDCQPVIDWEEIFYYKNSDNNNSSASKEVYRKWLKSTFDLDPIAEPDLLVKKAQDKYQKDFQSWFENYYSQ